jgi:hypothetical protein
MALANVRYGSNKAGLACCTGVAGQIRLLMANQGLIVSRQAGGNKPHMASRQMVPDIGYIVRQLRCLMRG